MLTVNSLLAENAPESRVIELTSATFETVVKKSKGVAVVDFFATWCGPCKQVKPVFAELSIEHKEWTFGTIDIDQAPEIMTECGVQAMPTFVVFKDGKQWGAIKGARKKADLLAEINTIIEAPAAAEVAPVDTDLSFVNLIAQRNVPEIKKMIAAGRDVNKAVATPMGNLTPLGVAITGGNEEIIDILFAAGATLNKGIEDAVNAQLTMYEELLANGQKLLTYAQKKSANGVCVADKKVVKTAIAHDNAEFFQAIALAKYANDMSMLKKLIEDGADVNCVLTCGKNESTPLGLACTIGNEAIVDCLLEAGASLEVVVTTDSGKKLPLTQAFQDEFVTLKDGMVKCRERLAYAQKKRLRI